MAMRAELFLRNKIKRHVLWNGQDLVFTRYKKDEYKQITTEVESTIELKGVFHEGGGYGGMLNIELYERDGSRSLSKMKPMILCMYEDARDIIIDDIVVIGNNRYRVVEKNDIKNFNIAFEISLEVIN